MISEIGGRMLYKCCIGLWIVLCAMWGGRPRPRRTPWSGFSGPRTVVPQSARRPAKRKPISASRLFAPQLGGAHLTLVQAEVMRHFMPDSLLDQLPKMLRTPRQPLVWALEDRDA